LESPSVLASGDDVYLALIESPAGSEPRVLVRNLRAR
jgi:hypothetical protein